MRRTALVVTALALVCVACSSGGDASTTATPPGSTAAATTVPEGPLASLEGLGFTEFVDASFDLLLLRNPQYVTELGIADRYGLRNDRLDDRSDAYLRETRDLESAILDLLRGYDPDGLDTDDRITYDVYEWFLDTQVRGHPFAYHDYPLHHMLGSYHWATFFYFTDSFPLETEEDAEDYVAAVGRVREQAEQVLDGLRTREEMGIYPPDFIIAMTRSAMLSQLGLALPSYDRVDPTAVDIYRRFEEDTAEIGMDPAGRDALLGELAVAITGSVVPAWEELIGFLTALEFTAGSDAGVWKLPDGEAYYSYLVRRETSTEMTPAEIHALGLAEVERIQGELRSLFAGLGYPEGESIAFSMNRIGVEGGAVTVSAADPDAVIEAYEGYVARIEPLIEKAFNLQPEAELVILPDRSFGGGGGYYSPGSLDGTRPGAFYAGSAPGVVGRYQMPTILHHEGVPGHHFQLSIAQELGLPLMRSVVHFNGFVEGWALYAERLTGELGIYEGDPYGEAGRLHLELLRAVRLVVDTGIHAEGWSRSRAQAYMNAEMGGWAHEVDRYVVLPAQALSYKVGMEEIVRLRETAEERLGGRFDLAAFHDVVLGSGSLPLEILQRRVTDWLAGQPG